MSTYDLFGTPLAVGDAGAPLAEGSTRRVVVGFSGGVTSAWCAGWALRTFHREEVILLWHDTKEEHPDTYRFLHEMAAALGMPITERSDGRSVTQVFEDEGFLGNNQNAMCSRILKVEQGDRHFRELIDEGVTHVVKVFGFGLDEPDRRQRMAARADKMGFSVRYPLVEHRVTKQACVDWCLSHGVYPSVMYDWADHANCIGCVKGGRAYWLAVAKNHPDVFEQRASMEEEFGHTILSGGGREHITLRQLLAQGMIRTPGRRGRIVVGACECGD